MLWTNSIKTYKTFQKSVNPEFERKVEVQNRTWMDTFSELFFLLIMK